MFIDWIKIYSELHFQIIGAVYNSGGITRGEIWRKIGKGPVREDSAEADLYKFLFRKLSTGGIIRQHRIKDYHGNFIKTSINKAKVRRSTSSEIMTSAFDDVDKYELTALGQQFVLYAMTDIPIKIEYNYFEEKPAYQ